MSSPPAPTRPKTRTARNAPPSIRASITPALAQHLPTDIILKLLRVHSYDVDFKRKVSPGDSFDVFFDGPEDPSDRNGIGEVLYTAMTVDGTTRSFYRFRTPDGLVDYYDQQGNSAKKFLMRNPVRGGRYTSGFGVRRHPLLNITRMHTGVDWAAPAGTPILAGADGTIEQVGRQGGYGNYIRIRHANGFSTAYGHLSRYADGLAPGAQVKQGQVIGYVGSTGFSTGPHCHYEILVNNKFVNPMTIQVPRGLQLTGKQLASFQRERNRIDTLRQMDPVTTNRVAQATHELASSLLSSAFSSSLLMLRSGRRPRLEACDPPFETLASLAPQGEAGNERAPERLAAVEARGMQRALGLTLAAPSGARVAHQR